MDISFSVPHTLIFFSKKIRFSYHTLRVYIHKFVILYVTCFSDEVEPKQSANSPDGATGLATGPQQFYGGMTGISDMDFRDVTRKGFRGCMKTVKYGSLAIDFTQNEGTIGTSPKCVPTVSFDFSSAISLTHTVSLILGDSDSQNNAKRSKNFLVPFSRT